MKRLFVVSMLMATGWQLSQQNAPPPNEKRNDDRPRPLLTKGKVNGSHQQLASDVLWPTKMIEASRQNETPQKAIVVAVVDTGIDLNHPALKNKLWKNSGESGLDKNGQDKSTNGIDDDRNGFIDDVHGWNFAGLNSNLQDQHGHGTHISGIIAAEKTNRSPYFGVAANALIMPLKYYDPKNEGQNQLKATIDAFRYAIKMGADVINYSAGGPTPNKLERQAIELAHRKGIVVVAAAGNEASNADNIPYYPASYLSPNILAVAGVDLNKRLVSTSNFGTLSVDVAAPGENIYSTLPRGQYGLMTGTSQATAFVTGLVARILGSDPELSPYQLKLRVENVVESNQKLQGKIKNPGVINVDQSLHVKGLFTKRWKGKSQKYKKQWAKLIQALDEKENQDNWMQMAGGLKGSINRAPTSK